MPLSLTPHPPPPHPYKFSGNRFITAGRRQQRCYNLPRVEKDEGETDDVKEVGCGSLMQAVDEDVAVASSFEGRGISSAEEDRCKLKK